MGRMGYAVLFFLCLFHFTLYASEQPPFDLSNPAANENDREIYSTMDRHKHNNDDSSRMDDVIPSSPSVYDLGSSSIPWQNIFASSSVVFTTQFSSQTLLVDGNPRLMPSFIGQIVLSSGSYDLWVATGLNDRASWKVFRSSGSAR